MTRLLLTSALLTLPAGVAAAHPAAGMAHGHPEAVLWVGGAVLIAAAVTQIARRLRQH
jgi:hypothetical protein